MSTVEIAVLLGAGAAAGAINTAVGAGTLISITAMLMMGFSPLASTVANAVGLLPGSAAGLHGYRRQLPADRRLLTQLAVLALGGAALGGLLLLIVPARSIPGIASCCILLSVGLVAVQPVLAHRAHGVQKTPGVQGIGHDKSHEQPRSFAQPQREGSALTPGIGAGEPATLVVQPKTIPDPPGRRTDPEDEPRGDTLINCGRLWTGTAVASIYSGVFAAGTGLILIGVFAAAIPGQSLQQINALKMWVATMITITSAAVFIPAGHVLWAPTLLIGAGTLVGGWFGASLGRRLPSGALRCLITATGVISAVHLLL